MEQVLKKVQDEYREALRAGRPVVEVCPWLAHTSSPTPPSPALAALNDLFVKGDAAGPPPEVQFAEDKLAELRVAFAGVTRAICGPLEVPAVPADAMKSARGVGGIWVSWPGVDTSEAAPTILYFHGGAMVQGTCDWSGAFLSRLSRVFGLRVLSVEYPLCPEHTAVEAVAGMVQSYLHLVEDLKVGPNQVLLAGESGGGQAVLLLLQALVARGLPVPAGAWVSCPVTRADEEAFAHHSHAKADGLLGTKGVMRVMADLIRRKGKPDELPYGHPSCSPWHGSVAGFPPCWFSWDRDEVLAFDSECMVAKLREAGVPVGTRVTGFGLHAILLWPIPEAEQDVTCAAAWLKKYLGGGGGGAEAEEPSHL